MEVKTAEKKQEKRGLWIYYSLGSKESHTFC